jgi:hypothetical protein
MAPIFFPLHGSDALFPLLVHLCGCAKSAPAPGPHGNRHLLPSSWQTSAFSTALLLLSTSSLISAADCPAAPNTGAGRHTSARYIYACSHGDITWPTVTLWKTAYPLEALMLLPVAQSPTQKPSTVLLPPKSTLPDTVGSRRLILLASSDTLT